MLVTLVYIGFFPSFNKESFIPAFPPPRGGVTGRVLFNDGVLVFFSDGFKIYKKNKLFVKTKTKISFIFFFT
jgi:hypothetical protein